MEANKYNERITLADGEYRFAEIIWESEPVNSTELVRLAGEKLGWKKATVYTVLRKLCEKGIMQNIDATVTSLIPKEEIQRNASIDFMEKNFHNSIPAFLAAFGSRKKMSDAEIEDLKKIIDGFRR